MNYGNPYNQNINLFPIHSLMYLINWIGQVDFVALVLPCSATLSIGLS
jgi:hypothetical protein